MNPLELVAEQLERLEEVIKEDLAKIEKRLDKIDEKLDTYHQETTKLKNDVSWIKGSAKVAITFGLTLVGALLTVFIKFIPEMTEHLNK